MNSHVDFVPKKTTVKVGELDLVAAELVAAQRDALVKMVGEKIQSVNVRAMLRDTRAETEETEDKPKAEGGVKIIDVVLEVFTGMLTDAECVVLDTPENRKRVAAVLGDGYKVPKLEDLPLHDKYGVEYWRPLWSWVRSSITDTQGLELIRQVVQLNDFVGLGKNLMALAADLFPGLGEGKVLTTTQGQ